jgi:DNA-binding winged helix-turn-helix (wHTH) protein
MLLRFADCELDPIQRTLRRGGVPVDVDPKALDLLALLAERSGALLPRAEMLRALWPDTVVSDAAVSQCVRRARIAIGDADRGARRIETVSRHGWATPAARACWSRCWRRSPASTSSSRTASATSTRSRARSGSSRSRAATPRAAVHLEDALRVHESIGAPARAAHTALDLARVTGSRSRAAELLGSAEAAARSLGLGGLAAEVERERATLH